MDKKKIINDLSKYFKVKELVSNNVYQKYGESAWKFFDTEFLHTLLVLRRDILCVPLVCNGGSSQQRGLRENTSPMVREKTESNKMYLSAHCLGKGCDLSSPKMTAEEMRKAIVLKASLLPYKVRIEKDVTWLHIDIMTAPDQKEKIYLFKAN